MRQILTVSRVFENSIEASFEKNKMCGCCRTSGICGQGAEAIKIKKENFQIKTGDKIEIEIDDKKSLQAFIFIFFLPLAVFLAILIATSRAEEWQSFAIAVLGIVLYYIILKALLSGRERGFEAKIIRKVEG